MWYGSMYENYLSSQLNPQVSPMVPSGRQLLVVNKATFNLMCDAAANKGECMKLPDFLELSSEIFSSISQSTTSLLNANEEEG